MINIKKETAGALAYLLGLLSGFYFLLTNKDEFVQFHAKQSIIGNISLLIVLVISNNTFRFLTPLIWLVSLIVWVTVMLKASKGEKWQIPIIGNLAKSI